MSSKDAPVTQNNIDKYFKGWIGISVSLSRNPMETSPTLYLEFSSKCHATSAYLFLGHWQNYDYEQSLGFSVVEEDDEVLTCYLYTPRTSFSKKEQFRDNFNLEKIKQFIDDQKELQRFRVVARYADENFDVKEVEENDVPVWLKSITYQKQYKKLPFE